MHLFEAAIDLLSYASFLQQYGADFRQENLLSLAGVYQPKDSANGVAPPLALTQFLKDYPHINKVYLHLDNDRVGQEATAAISAALSAKYEVKNDPPKCGKDFNEFLVIHNKRLKRNQSR